jgi:tetratricopeptide (TPR) repeat protein/DNA-binding MarR family transcriptional regulator
MEARVLLSLREWTDRRNDLIAPYWVTQRGISERSGVERANVSRVLRSLMMQKSVTERRAYVEGEGRAKKVYFLTGDGVEVAERLAEAERAFIVHPEGLRSSSPFVGRGGEIEAVLGWIRSPKTPAMYVHGLPGIGKTTLLLNVVDRVRSSASVFYFRLREWTSLAHFLRELAEFLARQERRALADHLDAAIAQGSVPDPGVALFDIERGLGGLRCAVILDDFHDLPESLGDFFTSFAEVAARAECRLLVAGRRQRRPFDARAEAAGKVKVMHLEGLDVDSLRKLLLRRETGAAVSDARLEEIHRLTKGNPLFAELLRDSADLKRPSAIREFLSSEVDSRLSPAERGLVRRLCVFRRPVPLGAFGDPRDLEAAGSLVSRSIVETDESRTRFSLHDLLREYFHHSLTPAEAMEAHTKAATFYEGSQDAFDSLEHVWHLRWARDPAELGTAVLARYELLVKHGLASSLLPILELEGAGASDARLALARGWCLISRGEFAAGAESLEKAIKAGAGGLEGARLHEALAHALVMEGDFVRGEKAAARGLEFSRKLPDTPDSQMAILRLRKSLGTVMRHRMRLKEAQREYRECLDLARRLGARREQGMFHNNLGVVYHRQGRDDLALVEYGRAVDAYRETGEARLVAQSTINSANILKSRGDFDRALEGYGEVLRIAERFGDRSTLIICYHNLAVLHAARGDFDLGRSYIQKGLELAVLTRNVYQVGMMHYGAGEVMELSGDLSGAERSLSEALKVGEEMGDRELLFRAGAQLARVLAQMSRLEDAERQVAECESLMKGVESPNLTSEVAFARALLLKGRGQAKRAAREVERALAAHAESSGSVDLRARMVGLQASLSLDAGDAVGAAGAMRVALEIYEKIGAKPFAAQTREALAKLSRAAR